jgi:transposase
MITFFNSKSNSLDENCLENIQNKLERQKYIQSFMPTEVTERDCKCPKCGAKCNFSYHASYVRNVEFLLNDELINFKVKVTRVMCKSCGSTHALFPSFVIPYKITSLNSILSIVKGTVYTTVLKLSNSLNISYQLIYMYINLVLSFFSDVCILNNSKIYYTNFDQTFFLNNIVNFNSTEFLIDYNHFHKWIFLMTKFRNISPPRIYIGSCKVAST